MKNSAKIVPEFGRHCRMAAAEGAVLLKNEEKTLPIKASESVALFGRCQFDTYRSGTGSGGGVNVPYVVNIFEGMKNSGCFQIDEQLAAVYKEWLKDHPYNNGGGGWAAEPWNQQEMVITDELAQNAAKRNEKAIYIIGRTAGEDKDYVEEPGSYLLTEEELRNLLVLSKHFTKIVVLMNVPSIVDMSWVDAPEYHGHITAVMYIWQGGMEAGNAVADLLSGRVTPCGKLTDTIAKSLRFYPAAENFNNGLKNHYAEDIYVGYRYFETFCPENVLYEFGFGLSYTTFSIEILRSSFSEKDIFSFHVKVINTGAFKGKEVVQIYVEAPQGSLGKPLRELKGFAKTKELLPGETQELIIRIPLEKIASYDDSGVTGNKSCYVLEKGVYKFWIGNSVRADLPAEVDGNYGYVVEKLQVIEKLQEALAPTEGFLRIKPQSKKEAGNYTIFKEPVPEQTIDLKERIMKNLPEEMAITKDVGIRLSDVAAGRADLKAFVAQLDEEELATLVRGEGMSNPRVTPGTAAAFGGVSDALHYYGIPAACCSDGPNGIRMVGGGEATQMPIGTLLACTFNTSLIEELYEMEGREMVLNEIDTLLGPGINIHRHPLNGRNFEYYSEDPYVTGSFAAAAVRGIKKGGSEATIKHFAANNQEKGRNGVDSIVSERALREIYLKGFEMAVKEGGAVSVMTSYNPVNGHWAATNYDLSTTILRKEWGFNGIVMTDWWAYMNHVTKGGMPNKQITSSMVRAQNDLYMVVDNDSAEINAAEDDTVEALKTGELTLGELQRSAVNICRFILHAPVMQRPLKPRDAVKTFEPLQEKKNESIECGTTWILRTGYENSIKLYVKKAGTYAVVAKMMSPQNKFAQAATNLWINDEKACTIQIGGTGGKDTIRKIINMELKQGVYEVRLEPVKPEIRFSWIEFRELTAERGRKC